MGGLVVVGVDGSESALVAVEEAAREARWRGASLRLVHAFIWARMKVPLGPPSYGPPEGGLRNMADRLAAEAVRRAAAAAPEVEVASVVVPGEPRTVLEAESQGAELVVVGSRGTGGFVGLLVGSTAVHLAAHGRCPVLVVREASRAAGPVLVGVDGSPASEAAVDFAFAEAALRGSGVLALHAWTSWRSSPSPAPRDPSMPGANSPGAAEPEEFLLAAALAGRRERYPGVPVEHRPVRGDTRKLLIEASAWARVLVVGARGRGGFTGLLLGSVSQAMLHHAHCPVAVVRAGGTGT
ncbi:universal stress protein [Streptomyces pacificus]|uniref:Universal stress protein n=1 Tax=Streptomyces pacificus TaxID=2705029 RepID=A0A6A0AQA8_9ACTN|nr:universal stress protein [Streptomyces pacificus]GFH34665.1 universal stress protein [Streptomyces pacificus]